MSRLTQPKRTEGSFSNTQKRTKGAWLFLPKPHSSTAFWSSRLARHDVEPLVLPASHGCPIFMLKISHLGPSKALTVNPTKKLQTSVRVDIFHNGAFQGKAGGTGTKVLLFGEEPCVVNSLRKGRRRHCLQDLLKECLQKKTVMN